MTALDPPAAVDPATGDPIKPDPTPPPTPPTPPAHFADTIQDADIRANPAVRKFGTLEELGRGYIELEKKIGEKGVLMPGPNATPQEVRAYMSQIGCPEAPDKYDLTAVKPPSEKFKVDEPFLTAMRESAWHYGLSGDQFRGIVEDAQKYQHTEFEQMLSDAQTRATEATDKIKVEWGAAYPAKIEVAKAAAHAIFGEQAEQLQFTPGPDGSEIGNNPNLLRILAELGEKMKEADLLPGAVTRLTKTGDEAKAELAQLLADPENMKALMDANHLKHKEICERRDTLYRTIYPSQEAASATTGAYSGKGVA